MSIEIKSKTSTGEKMNRRIFCCARKDERRRRKKRADERKGTKADCMATENFIIEMNMRRGERGEEKVFPSLDALVFGSNVDGASEIKELNIGFLIKGFLRWLLQ
jgi:hypothetical protein